MTTTTSTKSLEAPIQMAANPTVRGLKEAQAAFKALPVTAQTHLRDSAVKPTVVAIVRRARQRLLLSPSVRTRALHDHITSTVSKKTGRGRVGVSAGSTTIKNPQMGGIGRNTRKIKGLIVRGQRGGARLDRPSRRAHFVEFGTRHMRAEPFMVPAAEQEAQPFLSRCRSTRAQIEQDTAKIGGGKR